MIMALAQDGGLLALRAQGTVTVRTVRRPCAEQIWRCCGPGSGLRAAGLRRVLAVGELLDDLGAEGR